MVLSRIITGYYFCCAYGWPMNSILIWKVIIQSEDGFTICLDVEFDLFELWPVMRSVSFYLLNVFFTSFVTAILYCKFKNNNLKRNKIGLRLLSFDVINYFKNISPVLFYNYLVILMLIAKVVTLWNILIR